MDLATLKKIGILNRTEKISNTSNWSGDRVEAVKAEELPISFEDTPELRNYHRTLWNNLKYRDNTSEFINCFTTYNAFREWAFKETITPGGSCVPMRFPGIKWAPTPDSYCIVPKDVLLQIPARRKLKTASPGLLPGVVKYPRCGTYVAEAKIDSVPVRQSGFPTELDAHICWLGIKINNFNTLLKRHDKILTDKARSFIMSWITLLEHHRDTRTALPL